MNVVLTSGDWPLLSVGGVLPPDATPASRSAEDAGSEEDYCQWDTAPASDGLGQCGHRADVEIALDDEQRQTQTLTVVQGWQQLGDRDDNITRGLAFLANADTSAIRRASRATVEWEHADVEFEGQLVKGASTNVAVYDLNGLSEAYDWVIECAQTHFSDAEPR